MEMAHGVESAPRPLGQARNWLYQTGRMRVNSPRGRSMEYGTKRLLVRFIGLLGHWLAQVEAVNASSSLCS